MIVLYDRSFKWMNFPNMCITEGQIINKLMKLNQQIYDCSSQLLMLVLFNIFFANTPKDKVLLLFEGNI